MDEENDAMMLLGSDNDMTADWDNGVFQDNFRGVWGALDGRLVYMELNYAGEDYNLYSVPVLLNEEEYNLQIAYDFSSEKWSILGAWQGINENGMADKELRALSEGDKITTLWQLASYSGEDDFESYQADTFTVTENTAFSEVPLFDGTYRMVFEMTDAMGNTAYSDPVQFDCVGGEISFFRDHNGGNRVFRFFLRDAPPLQPLAHRFPEQGVQHRAQRDKQQHSGHAHDTAADRDRHQHPDRRQIHRIPHHMGIDQISFDLLDDLEKNHEPQRLHGVDYQDEKRTDHTADDRAEYRDQRGKRREDADEQGVGETENRQRDEKSAPRIQASRH